MTDKIIPLADIRYASRVPLVPAELLTPTGLLADTLARPLRDLRISVTDRCNFRCSYCHLINLEVNQCVMGCKCQRIIIHSKDLQQCWLVLARY